MVINILKKNSMSRVLLIKQLYIIDNRGLHVLAKLVDTLHDLHRLVSNIAIYIIPV